MSPWLKGVFYLKKRSIFVIGSILLTALVVCGMHVAATELNKPEGKLIMLADEGELAENVAKYALWQGVCSYAAEHGYEAWLVLAADGTQEARMQALEKNLSPAVRAVVGLGEDYEPVIYEAQGRYPGVNFLLLDGEPRTLSDSLYETRTNTHCLLFREDEAGFLAGFAAVMDGKRQLGFCGEGTGAEVIRYGYGFIQGAEAAAAELGLKNGDISIQYWYVEEELSEEEIQATVSQWYKKGTQVVSVYDHGALALTNVVIAAAEENGGLVLASGADCSLQGSAVLSSTLKDYCGQVQVALSSLDENRGCWNADRAGRSQLLGVSDGALTLAEESGAWRFTSLSKERLETLLEQLRQGCFFLDQGGNRERFPLSPHCTVKTHSN